MATLKLTVNQQSLKAEYDIPKIVEDSENYLKIKIIEEDDLSCSNEVYIQYQDKIQDLLFDSDYVPKDVLQAPGFEVWVHRETGSTVLDTEIISIDVYPTGDSSGVIEPPGEEDDVTEEWWEEIRTLVSDAAKSATSASKSATEAIETANSALDIVTEISTTYFTDGHLKKEKLPEEAITIDEIDVIEATSYGEETWLRLDDISDSSEDVVVNLKEELITTGSTIYYTGRNLLPPFSDDPDTTKESFSITHGRLTLTRHNDKDCSYELILDTTDSNRTDYYYTDITSTEFSATVTTTSEGTEYVELDGKAMGSDKVFVQDGSLVLQGIEVTTQTDLKVTQNTAIYYPENSYEIKLRGDESFKIQSVEKALGTEKDINTTGLIFSAYKKDDGGVTFACKQAFHKKGESFPESIDVLIEIPSKDPVKIGHLDIDLDFNIYNFTQDEDCKITFEDYNKLDIPPDATTFNLYDYIAAIKIGGKISESVVLNNLYYRVETKDDGYHIKMYGTVPINKSSTAGSNIAIPKGGDGYVLFGKKKVADAPFQEFDFLNYMWFESKEKYNKSDEMKYLPIANYVLSGIPFSKLVQAKMKGEPITASGATGGQLVNLISTENKEQINFDKSFFQKGEEEKVCFNASGPTWSLLISTGDLSELFKGKKSIKFCPQLEFGDVKTSREPPIGIKQVTGETPVNQKNYSFFKNKNDGTNLLDLSSESYRKDFISLASEDLFNQDNKTNIIIQSQPISDPSKELLEKITDNENNITAVQNRVSSAEANISSINNEIEEFKRTKSDITAALDSINEINNIVNDKNIVDKINQIDNLKELKDNFNNFDFAVSTSF